LPRRTPNRTPHGKRTAHLNQVRQPGFVIGVLEGLDELAAMDPDGTFLLNLAPVAGRGGQGVRDRLRFPSGLLAGRAACPRRPR